MNRGSKDDLLCTTLDQRCSSALFNTTRNHVSCTSGCKCTLEINVRSRSFAGRLLVLPCGLRGGDVDWRSCCDTVVRMIASCSRHCDRGTRTGEMERLQRCAKSSYTNGLI
jgi:hypothetical protein